MRINRVTLVTCLALYMAFTWGGNAQAKSFSLPQAQVTILVDRDGALHVTEELTYTFSGSFSGGYREIPRLDVGDVTNISVTEGGISYRPGASAELGSSGEVNTYGIKELEGATRVVWHYSAFNEVRTFTVRYTLRHGVTAHDDVVDANVQVWGDEWSVGLDLLNARMIIPKGSETGDVRVWGHPATVEGATELDAKDRGASLYAIDVPAQQWVELRVVFPRSLLSAEAPDAIPQTGDGLPAILAEEKANAESAARAARLRAAVIRLLPLIALIAFVPGLLIAIFIWRRFGREPDIEPVFGHVMEPPTNDPPALIPALLEPGHQRATGNAFAATLFDLIRRKHLDAMVVNTVRSTWGGLKTDDVTDLGIKVMARDESDLSGFDKIAKDAMQHLQGSSEHVLLSTIKEEIKKDQAHWVEVFDDFKKAVLEAVEAKGWWDPRGKGPLARITGAFVLLTFGFLAGAIWLPTEPVNQFPWWRVLLIALVVASGVNMMILFVFLGLRRGWERRTPAAAQAAAQWTAFKNFLEDFPGIPEAAPGSIAIWEHFLCYGIALGVADRVLAAAQLYAPAELNETSSVYWVSHQGHLGSGPAWGAISDIGSAVSSATVSSGGGGGFSGGGGGGSGGGGGGAW